MFVGYIIVKNHLCVRVKTVIRTRGMVWTRGNPTCRLPDVGYLTRPVRRLPEPDPTRPSGTGRVLRVYPHRGYADP